MPTETEPTEDQGPYSQVDTMGDDDFGAGEVESTPEVSKAERIAANLPDETEPEVQSVTAVEPASAPAADTQVDGTPSEPELESSLVELAARHGFTGEDAKLFGSSDNLRRALASLDAKAVTWAERQFTGQQSNNADPSATAQPSNQTTQPTDESIEKLKVDLDPSIYDEGTISQINKLNDHYDKVVRQLSGQLKQVTSAFNQITGQVQAEASTRQERELDAFFDSVGDEYKTLYGKGTGRSLNPNGSELAQRQVFVRNMELLKMADARNNQPPMSDAAMRDRVLAFTNPNLIKQTVRKEIQEQIEQRRQQAVARPSKRQAAPLTGEAKAVQRARQFYKTYETGHEIETPNEI